MPSARPRSAGLAIATAASGHGNGSLYVLAGVTTALKALLFPLGIRFVLRRLDADPRVPSTIGVPSSILIAIVLTAIAFVVMRPIQLGSVRRCRCGAAASGGGVLVAFLLMVVRPYAPRSCSGFWCWRTPSPSAAW